MLRRRPPERRARGAMQESLSDPIIGLAIAVGLVLLLATLLAGRRAQRVVAHPIAVLVGIASVSLVAGVSLFQLDPPALRVHLDPSTEPLLPRGDPAHEIYERAVREFGGDEIFVIAVEFDSDLFTRENLSLLQRVHREIARLDGVRRVQSLTEAVTFRYEAQEDWLDVGPLMDDVPETPAALAALRARAMSDPLLRRNLISQDGRAAGIAVRFREMDDRAFIASKLDERIGALLDAAARPGVHFHVAGRPHVKASVYRGMVRDLSVLIPLAIVVLAGLLAFATGTRRGVVLPLANVLLATLWTFGAIAASGRPLTILSTMLAPLLIAIGSVYGVHLLARFDEERRGPGEAPELAERTLRHVWLPIVISGATTQIGFMSLLAGDVPAVVELGAFATLGVGCVTFLSATGLPAALALLPARREVSALPAWLARWSERFSLELGRALEAIAATSVRHNERMLIGAALFGALGAYAIPRIVVDTDYLSFFHEDAPIRQDFASVDRLLAGAIPIYVVLRGEGEGAFREPEALHAIERLQARIDAIPNVSRTASIVDTLRVMNRAIEKDDPAEERIPDSRAAVMEMLQLAPKDEMARFTNPTQSEVNLVIRTGVVGSAAVRDLVAHVNAALREELPAGIHGEVTGNVILLARSADGIAGSQLQSIALASGSILVLVAVSLGSLRLGILALIPNLLPVMLFFGLLGFGAAPLSLPTSLIASTSLGISIDDTVHYLVRYRKERSGGLSPEAAALVASRRVGEPMVVTAGMLAIGFLVIALSEFATLREFGALSAATMVICLVGDVLLLPALVTRLRA